MNVQEPTLRYWWTRQETARDKTTGVFAIVEIGVGGWKWRVRHEDVGIIREGTSTTQKGARAACRRAVEKWSKSK